MTMVKEPWSARQQRQLAFVSEFTTDIQHVAGKDNVVADCLSRSIVDAVNLGVDYGQMAADQTSDPEVQALRAATTGLQLQEVSFGPSCTPLLCDVSTGVARPVVPVVWQQRIFEVLHNLSHPGRKASQKLLSGRFVWHGLKKDVRDWVNACLACQRAKVHKHTKAPLAPFNVPERLFDHVNVDLVGPLPPSRGYTHLLTIVDRTTRWPEVIPLTSTTTAEVARAFISAWVSRFGVPADLSSDRGAQFTSELWAAIARQLGVTLHWTTAYHPQANGMCERFHRSLKVSLRAALQGDAWVDTLPWVLLGLRTAPKADLGASSAELVYGQPLHVPGEFLPSCSVPWSATRQLPVLRDGLKSFAPVPTTHHGLPRSHVHPDLGEARFVFVRQDKHRGPLQPPYEGPFRVIKSGEKFFVLDIGGRSDRITIDRLKPAHVDLDSPVEVACPPRRGRPPALRSRNPVPDLNPDPGDSPKTDSGMGPDPSGAAGKKLGRFGRVIQTPRRFCCHSKFWGDVCSEHWRERGRIPCGNTPTFSDSPDR
ncbi:hypothetical protein AAFF_G00399960 [Aldrovandia affinis]|uniref:Gypsy retrotransposon integrase-like protein 1 n=1 Tax=Aldrovandia affinis TaxID=143900 RepID=A0AAD7R3R0_9TELE|nr:hypothetical protein AAFF_G00399960 [Aldrovandia affinis]